MQVCPPSWWAAKTSASSMPSGLIDWSAVTCASAHSRLRNCAACSNSSLSAASVHQLLVHLRARSGFRRAGTRTLSSTRRRSPRADFAGARRRAALDLVQQAGPGAAVEHAVGTGAQQEGALQHVDRAVDGAGRGEGAEVVALRLRAPRCLSRSAAPCDGSRAIRMYGNDLSSRSSTLKRGRKRLIRLASSSSASASVRTVTNSIAAVAAIMRAMRLEWPSRRA